MRPAHPCAGQMRLTLATDAGSPPWPNEDFAAVGPGAAVLLDGATTVPSDADTGWADMQARQPSIGRRAR
jgi:hypothetical protein